MGFFEKMFSPKTPDSSGQPETPSKDKEMPMAAPPPGPELNDYDDPTKKYNEKEKEELDVNEENLNDGTGINEIKG